MNEILLDVGINVGDSTTAMCKTVCCIAVMKRIHIILKKLILVCVSLFAKVQLKLQ